MKHHQRSLSLNNIIRQQHKLRTPSVIQDVFPCCDPAQSWCRENKSNLYSSLSLTKFNQLIALANVWGSCCCWRPQKEEKKIKRVGSQKTTFLLESWMVSSNEWMAVLITTRAFRSLMALGFVIDDYIEEAEKSCRLCCSFHCFI